MKDFPTALPSILDRLNNIAPRRYARTRNYLDGAVTYLSPYISRGVLSTKMVLEHVMARGFQPSKIEKFIQELAWRDYWQQVWVSKGSEINQDLRRSQPGAEFEGVPTTLLEAQTGVEAIDQGLHEFYETGYLHNHLRMYVAALACTLGRCHWREPARWMYYHLLDGDWASNALSWQWVAGANSGKQYVANQKNINRYCHSAQKGTFLDKEYPDLLKMSVPEELQERTVPNWVTKLPASTALEIDPDLPNLIYNSYQLDPNWKSNLNANRILLLEPRHFDRYPVSSKVLKFILGLTQNIPGIQICCENFEVFIEKYSPGEVYFKEHPLSRHYSGVEEPREWMFEVEGYYRSFFAFWKKCKKELKDI